MFIALAMGLAMRDVYASHFMESDAALPNDIPEWVINTPLEFNHMTEVMAAWGKNDYKEGAAKKTGQGSKGKRGKQDTKAPVANSKSNTDEG